MHSFKLASLSGATVMVFALSAYDAAADIDACTILPAKKFSEIMGYGAQTKVSSGSVLAFGRHAIAVSDAG